jgi:hypothetical protein
LSRIESVNRNCRKDSKREGAARLLEKSEEFYKRTAMHSPLTGDRSLVLSGRRGSR